MSSKYKTKYHEAPVGQSFWVQTKNPDDYGKLKASIIVSGEVADKFQKELAEINDTYHQELEKLEKKKLKKKDPITSTIKQGPIVGKDGTKYVADDKYLITFKVPAVKGPSGKEWNTSLRFYDAAGKQLTDDNIPEVIWNGSKIKLLYSSRQSAMPAYGYGCKFELAGIQIISLKETTTTGFVPSAEEGSFYMEEKDTVKKEETTEDVGDVTVEDEMDDEIPF